MHYEKTHEVLSNNFKGKHCCFMRQHGAMLTLYLAGFTLEPPKDIAVQA